MPSTAINTLQQALERGMANRPKVGGFPYLAEALRQAGVQYNHWHLPACTSIYILDKGTVVNQGSPLIDGMTQLAPFDQESLINALRTDQAGKSTFAEFLRAAWNAGVTSYTVDFTKRTVSYYGINGECYTEEYPKI